MLKAVCRFERDRMLRSSKLMVPLLLLIAYTGIAYSMAPLSIPGSFGICSLVVFMLALGVGVMCDDLHIPAIDGTIFVKMRRTWYFYLAKTLTLAWVSLLFSLISVFAPLLIHVFGGSLFDRVVVFSDIYSGLALFWLVAMSGGMAGLFANYRIIRGRKAAIALAALFGVLAIVKGAINNAAEPLKFLTWILPPVYDISTAYGANKYFDPGGMWMYFAWLAVYVAIKIALYIRIMQKRGFE